MPKVKAFTESSLAAADVLPWKAVEPFTPDELAGKASVDTARELDEPPHLASAIRSAELSDPAEIQNWVRAKAAIFNSKHGSRGRLFHFELWLEPPRKVKEQLAAVAYAFNSPSILPHTQRSTEQVSGFRVAFGGLACPENVTLTLTYKDGRSQEVSLNACRLLA
jgi:hypothetical protein